MTDEGEVGPNRLHMPAFDIGHDRPQCRGTPCNLAAIIVTPAGQGLDGACDCDLWRAACAYLQIVHDFCNVLDHRLARDNRTKPVPRNAERF